MARLEGKKPNAGAIIIGAIIFSLVAAGLFFAFKTPSQPDESAPKNAASASTPDAADNSAPADANANSDSNSGGDAGNDLSTILTPIPTATVAPMAADNAVTDNAAMTNGVAGNAAATNAAAPGN